MQIFLLILFGLLGGVFGGMGMGGGTLLIPLLTIFLSLAQHAVQGYNLLAFIPMSIIALIIHTKNHLVEWKKIWLVVVYGLIFCILGAFLANIIDNKILNKLFGLFLIILSMWQFIEIVHKK